jgi:hypothetical protein
VGAKNKIKNGAYVPRLAQLNSSKTCHEKEKGKEKETFTLAFTFDLVKLLTRKPVGALLSGIPPVSLPWKNLL